VGRGLPGADVERAGVKIESGGAPGARGPAATDPGKTRPDEPAVAGAGFLPGGPADLLFSLPMGRKDMSFVF
jgi:hypothetical protein